MTTIAVNVAADTTISATVTETVVAVNVVGPPTFNVEIQSGVPGPQGPPGPAGGSAVTFPAGETLSSGRAVIIQDGAAFYFQHNTAAHHGRCYGITITSASSIGADVDVQVAGVRSDAAFNFTANKVLWVGANGVISDTLPTGGALVQKAGISGEENKMVIDFSVSTKIN